MKSVMLALLYILFFRTIGTKAWSMLGGYDTRHEAVSVSEQMIEGGPYEFRIVYALGSAI